MDSLRSETVEGARFGTAYGSNTIPADDLENTPGSKWVRRKSR